MAWRASLNEGLRTQSVRQKQTRRWTFGSMGLGLAAASCAALLILPTLAPQSRSLSTSQFGHSARVPVVSADELFALDGEGAAASELSGAGLAARESDLTEGEIQVVLASQML